MYAVTVETLRSGQARHAHLSIYCGNQKNVYACVLQYRCGARSYRDNPNNVYVCILYCRISARRTFTQLKWQPQLVVSVTYHPRIRQTKVYVLSCHLMAVHETSMWECDRDWQCYGVYKVGLLLAEGKRLKHLKEKPQHKTPYHYLSFFVEKNPAADATDATQP
jgi:hypothetical protein